ncbi:MAG: NAD(P)-binding domain-containing protein [Actinomycetota bacterium]
MRVGILGTGGVGRALAAGFEGAGHDVMIGTRDVEALLSTSEADAMGTPPFATWRQEHPDVAVGTFAEAGAHGELWVNATLGSASIDALRAAGAESAEGRTVIDTSNPLDFSRGFPPSLFVGNTDSLAEQIQRAFPGVHVVKAWNTMTAALMTEPALLADGDHTIPICGDDGGAKDEVAALLTSFGWRDVLDLGALSNARAMESYVTLWLAMFTALGTPMVNVKAVR